VCLCVVVCGLIASVVLVVVVVVVVTVVVVIVVVVKRCSKHTGARTRLAVRDVRGVSSTMRLSSWISS